MREIIKRAMEARRNPPKRGKCKCKPEPGELDQGRIAMILGSSMVCLKCGKRKGATK